MDARWQIEENVQVSNEDPLMAKTTIYHNPRCSKSRQTLELLNEQGLDTNIVEYLKNPPDAAELENILDLLGLEPRELMRTNEAEYTDLKLDDASLGREQLIAAMVEHPRLIQRPIVLSNGKAALGRPPESVLEII
jgi:arsenate reductase